MVGVTLGFLFASDQGQALTIVRVAASPPVSGLMLKRGLAWMLGGARYVVSALLA